MNLNVRFFMRRGIPCGSDRFAKISREYVFEWSGTRNVLMELHHRICHHRPSRYVRYLVSVKLERCDRARNSNVDVSRGEKWEERPGFYFWFPESLAGVRGEEDGMVLIGYGMLYI